MLFLSSNKDYLYHLKESTIILILIIVMVGFFQIKKVYLFMMEESNEDKL
jgi:hypothetical protein